MSFGLAMGPRARQNAARKTGQQELMEKIALEKERACNVQRVRNWSAPPCDCPTAITYTLRDGRVIRTCGEHMSTLSTLIEGGV